MQVTVLSPGLFTTIQDRGRFGYIASGIGPSGAMDADALEAANWLVGNRQDEAVLEATLLGPTLLFEKDCICALTGADMGARIGSKPVPRYQPFWVQAGQTLTLGAAVTGCRGYLALQGGIQLPPELGSRSTNLKCALGGYAGRALRRGDRLPVPDETHPSCIDRRRRPVTYDQQVEVRVIPGPQADAFPQSAFDTLTSASFTLSDQSDRMGLRLAGPVIETVSGSDIISDGIALGAIQITSAGQPIILMADRQTTGGYAKIGTVCTVDLPKLAQLRPGGTVRFSLITVEQAQRLLRKKKWRLFK